MESTDESSTSSKDGKKYIGVRQRPSGRWAAEVKDSKTKVKRWLGTFDTPEDAARAYDEAVLNLRGPNARTNFIVTTSRNLEPFSFEEGPDHEEGLVGALKGVLSRRAVPCENLLWFNDNDECHMDMS